MDRNNALLSLFGNNLRSLSARRAWIEIGSLLVAPVLAVGSLSARRAWIEIVDYIIDYVNDASLSARRAWIEMPCRS